MDGINPLDNKGKFALEAYKRGDPIVIGGYRKKKENLPQKTEKEEDGAEEDVNTGESNQQKEETEDSEKNLIIEELPLDEVVQKSKTSGSFIFPDRDILSPAGVEEHFSDYKISVFPPKSFILSSFVDDDLLIPEEFKVNPFFIFRLSSYLTNTLGISQASTLNNIISYFIYLHIYRFFISNMVISMDLKNFILSESYYEEPAKSDINKPSIYEIDSKEPVISHNRKNFGLI